MSLPRRILPGSTYLITRRATRRHHLFSPDPAVRELFLYSLTVTAKKFGILVLTVIVMSTHEHLLVTDPDGRLPDFLREFHRLVALGTKQLRKWSGPVWDHEKTSVVQLMTSDALIEKLAYCMANPVAAGLVPHASEWPGLTTAPADLGHAVLKSSRPKVYFNPNSGRWPTEVNLQLAMPPSSLWPHSAEELQHRVSKELEHQESAAHARLRQQRRRFVGAEACLRTSTFRRARSYEPIRSGNPCLAVGRGRGEELRNAVGELREFRRAYGAALREWRNGKRGVLFPAGTWWMRRFHAASVAATVAISS